MLLRPPLPPFTLETARVKVKAAQDAWNTKSVPRLIVCYDPRIERFLGIRNSSRAHTPPTRFGGTGTSSLEARMRSWLS
jgi:hypothetical protein